MNWKEKIKKISPALLEDIAKKLGFNKTSEGLLNMWDIEQAEKKYQNFVIQQCKMLYVLGANQASELGSIFTHIHVIQDKDRFRFQDPNSIPEGNPQESIKGIDYIQNEKNQNKNFFIMGGPGAGKTTFLKWMATAAAKKEQGFTKTPIFLELRAWADSQKDLQTYIAEELFKPQGIPNADTFVEKILLQEGNAILFLDGLDEIRTENNQRERVINSIVEFQKKYHTNRFFLTCRNYATEYSFTAFEYIHISPFNEEQIQTFISQWFHDKVPTAQDILQKIQQKEHTDIRELVSLPVFLSMFCLYYENVGSVPADRSELYDKAFQGLLVKIDAQNNRKRDDFYTSFTPTNREKLYYQLAYNTFNSKNQRFSKETVIETIQEFYGTLPEDKKAKDFDANKVFQMMAEQHGIIAEKLKDEFGFSHLTLQEYAVAKYLNGLADTPLRETILENITDTRWRNVFTYTVQIMSENKTPIFFNAFVTKMKTLILAPDSQTRQIWKWISKRKPNPKKDYKLFY
ncbi:MAG: NACHT domain-containing protein, partial [Chitinophagaceae bacterium]|nr:NACHT domain-containing protein [Chitinophagaceae bacterium]